jgi:valyl-tRNA synthetase
MISFWLFNTLLKSRLHFGKNPWKYAMISGYVTLQGEKMSKSLGNVVNPQDVMDKYGSDAIRYWAASSKLGEDFDYQEKDVVTGKKFVTKLMNASNFIFGNIRDYKPKKTQLTGIDKMFLLKVNELVHKCTKAFENYEYSKAKSEADNFFWRIFCDNYLEIVKYRVYNGTKEEKESAFYTLYNSLLVILKLMAPFTPFITEDIYQTYFRKNEKHKSIHISEWPKAEKIKDDAENFNLLVDVIGKIRKAKSQANKPMNTEVRLELLEKDYHAFEKSSLLNDLKHVANAREIVIAKKGEDMEVGFYV